MTEKQKSGKEPWIDPDDAPEWTQEDFDHAAIYRGGKLIRPGRPKKGDSKDLATLRIDPEGAIRPGRPRKADPKQLTSLRLDPAVIAAFRASGPGWQTKINAVLKVYIQRKGRTVRKPRTNKTAVLRRRRHG